MPQYSIYGLTLDSELPFPELPETSVDRADVSLRLGVVEFNSAGNPPGKVLYKPITPAEVLVHFDRVGAAKVENGRTIVLAPASKVDPISLRLFALQQVLGVALLQRGCIVLHASAAAINGRAVAFAGGSGEGKSTIVAALADEGAVIADDVLAVRMENTAHPLALPGLTQLKLNEEARSLTRAAVPMGQRGAKTLCAMPSARTVEPAGLAAIFLLETAKALSLSPLPKSRAAVELVRHTYGSRLLHAIGIADRHFQQTVELARAVPMFVLSRPRDLSLMPKIVEAIKQQLL